jgi:addiction module HigA family antidote
MSKSSTITNPDWLHNSHAGELLLSEFLEPLNMTADALASAIEVPVARVKAVIEGRQPMDADLDLRLGRYFRMSEGFFLRLQDSYELLEAKRTLNGDLDRIVPRAA